MIRDFFRASTRQILLVVALAATVVAANRGNDPHDLFEIYGWVALGLVLLLAIPGLVRLLEGEIRLRPAPRRDDPDDDPDPPESRPDRC